MLETAPFMSSMRTIKEKYCKNINTEELKGIALNELTVLTYKWLKKHKNCRMGYVPKMHKRKIDHLKCDFFLQFS